MVKFSVTIIFFLSTLFIHAQNIFEGYEHLFSTPGNYVVYRTSEVMKIDGKPDEISWQKADWSEHFQDIEGDKKPVPTYFTHMKMLWDEQNLYILAELEEPHIWAYYTKRDQIVYHENDFEIFIDPDRDTHNYFEFEINARNTLFDLFMPLPYRNGGKYDIGWDAEGFKSAVFIDGTINDPRDTDKKWMVEVAIPFSALKLNDDNVVPLDGEFWKINFSRVQWHTEIVDGKYQKIKDATSNKFLSEENWVWSEQGVINMHYPERWGLALFSTNLVGGDKIAFAYPDEEILGRFLWLIYYKQQNFKKVNGKYAESLLDLDLENEVFNVFCRMDTNEGGFNAYLDNKKGVKLSINHEGLFKIKNL